MSRAEQIIDLDLDGVIKLDERKLRNILMHDNIKDKFVCVLSITGAFRQGKSFLMNFLTRYLQVTYKDRKNVAKWLDDNDGPLKRNFSWRCGVEPHTTGIYMYSEVFLGKNAAGEEVAIILLDSQGTFDNKTSVNNCSKIFALSTLISSLQIYNLKDIIKQYDLEHLEYFAGRGNSMQDKTSLEAPPFQNLVFLIRDWFHSDEYDFGLEGGREFLDKQLDETFDQDLSLIELKHNVKKLFQKLDCFLMPFPGSKVSKFNGDISVLEKAFLEYVQVFATTFLNPKALAIKTINNEKITVSELYHLIKKYCEKLQSDDTPQLLSMIEVAAEVQCHRTIEKALELYNSVMNIVNQTSTEDPLDETALQERDDLGRAQAISFFEENRRITRKAIKKRYKVELERKLQEALELCTSINNVKFAQLKFRRAQEEEAAKVYYTQMIAESLDLYDMSMLFLKDRSVGSLTDEEFQIKHLGVAQKSIEAFEKGMRAEHQHIYLQFLEILKDKLQSKFHDYENYNLLKRKIETSEKQQLKDAENELIYKLLMDDALALYDSIMSDKCGATSVEEKQMMTNHKDACSQTKKFFKEKKISGSDKIYEKYFKFLEQAFTSKLKEYQHLNSNIQLRETLDQNAEFVRTLKDQLTMSQDEMQKFREYVDTQTNMKDQKISELNATVEELRKKMNGRGCTIL